MAKEMNKSQLKSDWDLNGYVVVPNFMNVQEVSDLRTEIERYISNVVQNVPENEVMYEVDPSAMYFEPENEEDADTITVTQEEFEEEYEVK